jgi:hypothetical protein
MRYLKKFESFNENKQEPLELAAEILAMVGKKVTPEEVESKIEAAVKDGESQSEGEEGEKVQVQNESVSEFLTWWTDIMSQQQWNPGTLDYNMTVSAFGAWLATIATGAVSTALAATGIYKVGKAIKGLFKGKEVDYTEFVKEWCKKNNVDLSKVDLNTEEGKQIMARMYKDFEAAGGKI